MKYDTIYKKAACYLEGIARLHPFPDGNKRTAILATFVFLQANRHYMVLPLDTVRFLTNVAREAGSTGDEIDDLIGRIAAWLEERTAIDAESYKAKIEEYVVRPLSGLKKLGPGKAMRVLEDWFVVDFHPEYKSEITDIAKFLTRTLADSSEAMNEIRNRTKSA